MALDSDYFEQMKEEGLHPICRGKPLYRMVEELKEGRRPRVKGATVVGGYSDKLSVCRRFSRPTGEDIEHMLEDEKEIEYSAVYMTTAERMQKDYPGLIRVCYTKEWLKERPDVAKILCQDPKAVMCRDLEEIIGEAAAYGHECEWVVPSAEKVKPTGGKLMVYVDKDDLVDEPSVKHIIRKVEARLPPLPVDSVEFAYCPTKVVGDIACRVVRARSKVLA